MRWRASQYCRGGPPAHALTDIYASRCAFALLRSEPGTSEDNLKAFINTLGNTQVLQREAEAALGDVVRKGAVAKQRMAAQEEQLGRAPTLAEAAAEQACLIEQLLSSVRVLPEVELFDAEPCASEHLSAVPALS